MSPRSVLTLIATLVAAVTLCLAGYQITALVNQGADALAILFAASSVLTSVVCIACAPVTAIPHIPTHAKMRRPLPKMAFTGWTLRRAKID